MLGRVLFQMTAGGLQQRCRGAGARVVPMHECGCNLDQPLVKAAVGIVPRFKPEFLQRFVGFKETALIEVFKER